MSGLLNKKGARHQSWGLESSGTGLTHPYYYLLPTLLRSVFFYNNFFFQKLGQSGPKYREGGKT